MSSMPPLPQLSSGGAPAFQTQARGCGISYEATGHLRLLPCLSGNRLPASCAAEACLRVSEGMLSRHSGPFLRALASGALHDPAAWTAFRDLSIAQVSDEKKRSADTVPLNSGSDANLTSRLRARLFFFFLFCVACLSFCSVLSVRVLCFCGRLVGLFELFVLL